MSKAAALAVAERYARKVKRYADGGDVDPGESWSPDDVPLPPPRPNIPAPSPDALAGTVANLKRYESDLRGKPPETPPPPDGQQSLTEYHPTARENISAKLLGDNPSPERRQFVHGLTGSEGAGTPDTGLVDWVPGVGQALQAQAGAQHGSLTETAMAVMPGGAKGALVKGAEHAAYDLAPNLMSQLKKVGPQMGSNPGGLFEAPSGNQVYVKTPKTVEHALNEKLAAELYKEVGVPTAPVYLTEHEGRPSIASRMVPGTRLDKHLSQGSGEVNLPGLQEHFPADAWLGNYDSVGTGFDNVIIDNKGVAHRIDMGGSLRFRAQGAPKGDKFGNEVTELDTMRDPSINPYAADVFGGHEIEPENKTAQKIASLPDDRIKEIVNKWGPVDKNERAALADKLIARRDNLAERYGLKKPDMGGTEPSGDMSFDEYNARPVKEQVKLMNLKKSHSLSDYVKSLKGYNYEDLPAGPTITQTQKQKIGANLAAYSPTELAEKLKGLPEEEVKNVLSWAPTSHAAKVETALEGAMAPAKIYEPNFLPDKATLPETIASIKTYLPTSGAISYPAYTKIKEILKDASINDLAEQIKDLPVNSQYKVKQWVNDADPMLGALVESKLFSEQKKKEAKSYADEFAAHIKPINDWSSYHNKQKDVQSARQWMTPEKIKHATAAGFNPDLVVHHGGDFPFGTTVAEDYPVTLKDPSFKPIERGFFTAHDPHQSLAYGKLWGGGKGFILAPKKPMETDWVRATGQDFYSGYYLNHMIEAARGKGADLLVVNNMTDNHMHNGAELGKKAGSQYIILNPAIARSPIAKFNPSELHLAKPLASIAGGVGLGAAAQKKGDQEDHMNRGGKTKDSPVKQTIRKLAGGGMSGMSEKGFIPRPPRLGRLGAMPHVGMIHSVVPGRTDKLPMHVRGGSYVVPSDIVSGIGQGNSMAGANAFNKLLGMGPYGAAINKVATPKVNMGHTMRMSSPLRMSVPKPHFKEGGVEGDGGLMPIIAAGGEYVIPPEKVREIGGGDLTHGHDVLDKLVLHLRKKTVHEMRKLKPPKRN